MLIGDDLFRGMKDKDRGWGIKPIVSRADTFACDRSDRNNNRTPLRRGFDVGSLRTDSSTTTRCALFAINANSRFIIRSNGVVFVVYHRVVCEKKENRGLNTLPPSPLPRGGGNRERGRKGEKGITKNTEEEFFPSRLRKTTPRRVQIVLESTASAR